MYMVSGSNSIPSISLELAPFSIYHDTASVIIHRFAVASIAVTTQMNRAQGELEASLIKTVFLKHLEIEFIHGVVLFGMSIGQ
jgi:hypothetical protein